MQYWKTTLHLIYQDEICYRTARDQQWVGLTVLRACKCSRSSTINLRRLSANAFYFPVDFLVRNERDIVWT